MGVILDGVLLVLLIGVGAVEVAAQGVDHKAQEEQGDDTDGHV